ncbi:hypothetical protein MKX01_005885, partial [Papaver californicum]
ENMAFTVLAQIISIKEKWLIVYYPIYFTHMSHWERRTLCKTCLTTVQPTTR